MEGHYDIQKGGVTSCGTTLIPSFTKIHASVWKLLGQTWSHKPACLYNRVRKFRFCCVKGISLWPLRCDLEDSGERRTMFCGVNCVGMFSFFCSPPFSLGNSTGSVLASEVYFRRKECSLPSMSPSAFETSLSSYHSCHVSSVTKRNVLTSCWESC